MRAFQVTENRSFMKLLLSEDCFDDWLLYEATIKKGASLVIEGRSDDGTVRPYKAFRKVLYEFIRGKETPSYMKIVFLSNEEKEGVKSRSLNVIFRDGKLSITTGVALAGFTLDKSLEQEWDAAAEAFIKGLGVEVV